MSEVNGSKNADVASGFIIISLLSIGCQPFIELASIGMPFVKFSFVTAFML